MNCDTCFNKDNPEKCNEQFCQHWANKINKFREHLKQMKLKPIKLNTNKLMKDITVEVNLTGLHILRVRLFFGVLLFRVAGFIIGCGITTRVYDDETIDVTNLDSTAKDNS